MSGHPVVVGSFVAADYAVLALVLTVSAAIGVYYAWVGRGRENSKDFLTGGRRLTALPVSLSLCASFLSSTTLLGNPAEVYCYGGIFVFFSLAFVLTVVITSELFLPFFYRLALTSTYEYLELRFNRAARLLGTGIFMVQSILFAGLIIYGPALALSQVTDINLWTGVISMGVICTLYCTLGGLKAVVWTDVFQIGIMLTGYLSVIIKSVILQGGAANIISDAQRGGRLNFWEFDLNPLRRHTFWTLTVGGTASWVAVYGINQCQVQRYVSCKSVTHARVALYVNLLGLCAFLASSMFAGMSLYSVYKDCDPWTAGFVSTPDQLMPYLVMQTLADSPGLPGLFMAALYSGSLSTASSSINALAAVTVEDLIKPYTNMSEKHLSWASKGLTFFYGVVCITMAALASLLGGLMQAGLTITGVTGGPLLGLFLLGILCPFANSKGALSGLVTGLVVTLCLSVGALISPPPPEMTRPLPLTTEGCNFTAADGLNWTSTALPPGPSGTTAVAEQSGDGSGLLAEEWHSPSYLYFSLIGTVTAVTVGVILSLCTGGWRERAESRLMLMKEDTTLYHVCVFFKDKVTRRTGRLDMAADREKRCGSSNPAFYSTELDFTR